MYVLRLSHLTLILFVCLDNVCVETKSFDSYFVCLFVCSFVRLFIIYLFIIIFDDISVCL